MTELHGLTRDFDDPEMRRLPILSLDRLWSAEAYERFGPPADVHPNIARRFDEEGLSPVLDIGCGSGALARGMNATWIGLDHSIAQLRQASGARVLGDAARLPFPDGVFAGAAALYVLYFFDDPGAIAAEARRVLRRGGLFAVCAPSRDDAPELAHVVPDLPDHFASEDIPGLLAAHFAEPEVFTWDAPLFDLSDRETVRDYLYSWYYPNLTLPEAERRAAEVTAPLKLTKRGAWGFGRRS